MTQRSSETGVPIGDPSGRSLTRPPLIRWGHGGMGRGYDSHTSSALDRTLPSVPPVREGVGWGARSLSPLLRLAAALPTMPCTWKRRAILSLFMNDSQEPRDHGRVSLCVDEQEPTTYRVPRPTALMQVGAHQLPVPPSCSHPGLRQARFKRRWSSTEVVRTVPAPVIYTPLSSFRQSTVRAPPRVERGSPMATAAFLTSPVGAAAVQAFRTSLQGDLLGPCDPGYGDARRVFNAMIDRRPALIARPTHAEDIRRAGACPREHDLPLSIKGGGHSIGGSAVCAGGLMIDCSRMNGVQVDYARRTAVAQPGVLLA